MNGPTVYKAGNKVFVINVTDHDVTAEEMRRIAEEQMEAIIHEQKRASVGVKAASVHSENDDLGRQTEGSGAQKADSTQQDHGSEKQNDSGRQAKDSENQSSDNSMTYEEFVQELQHIATTRFCYKPDEVRFLKEGYSSDDPGIRDNIRDINRTYENRDDTTLLTDILLLNRKLGRNMGIVDRISTRSMYETYQNEGLEAALSYMPDYQKPVDEPKVDLKKTSLRMTGKYTDIRDQLIIRPKNYRKNSATLKSAVYKTVGEVALILYQLIGYENGQLYTSRIDRNELKNWGMEGQEEKVLQEALENTAKLYPPCVYNWMTGETENFLTGTFTRRDISALDGSIMLSTFQTTNGAAALFYPGVREKMLNIMGGPFAAVFMNVNDVMIIDLRNPMLKTWLGTAAEPIANVANLSDKCYLCNRDGISMIDI